MMKPRLLLVALLATITAIAPMAQEIDFADHELDFAQIEKEWQTKNLFTMTRSEKTDIGEYLLSFVNAYPNEMCNMIVAHMMGYDTTDLLGEVVIDKPRGYISAYLLTELMPRIQMCHWRCNDGGTLVAVAFTGVQYKTDDTYFLTEDSEDSRVVSITDMMFYKIDAGEVMWQPRTLAAMCGRAIDLRDYNIELPRQGKNIVLRRQGNTGRDLTLVWNGSAFTIK